MSPVSKMIGDCDTRVAMRKGVDDGKEKKRILQRTVGKLFVYVLYLLVAAPRDRDGKRRSRREPGRDPPRYCKAQTARLFLLDPVVPP